MGARAKEKGMENHCRGGLGFMLFMPGPFEGWFAALLHVLNVMAWLD